MTNSMSYISERSQIDAFAGIVGLIGETVDEIYADGSGRFGPHYSLSHS